jgi:mannosyl-oligosaccharide alpha-1,2-mannosidase
LTQAKAVADSLKVAFTTPSGCPDGTLYFNPTHHTAGSATNSAAGAGSLILEWTRLSDLTGDDSYAQLAAKAESFLLNPTGVPGPWPGLIGTDIDLKTGQFVDAVGGWGASSDSGYEYMIKAYLYDPKTFEQNKDRWVLAAESTIAHLASHPTTRPQLTFLSAFNGMQTNPNSQHRK